MNDSSVIAKQLGRFPDNYYYILKRCIFGYPQVIKCAPDIKNKPFPTLYWLTCPYINKQIDKLENKGMIRDISNIISNDNNLKKKYIEITEKYIKERIDFFYELFPDKKINSILENTGIGGIRNWKHELNIKCIHLHFAYYMVNSDEVVGNIIRYYVDLTCKNNFCNNF